MEFAEKLKQYPILPDDPVKEQWGYEMHEGDDLVLSIEVAPLNTTGDLVVRVELADHFDREHRLRTAFVTNYGEVASFAAALSALMAKTAPEAVLTGK